MTIFAQIPLRQSTHGPQLKPHWPLIRFPTRVALDSALHLGMIAQVRVQRCTMNLGSTPASDPRRNGELAERRRLWQTRFDASTITT
jgi:hypothetical protein